MAEFLMRRIKVVKSECGYIFRVSTNLAFTAFVSNRLVLKFFSSLIDKKFTLAFDVTKPTSFSNLINARFPRTFHMRLGQF